MRNPNEAGIFIHRGDRFLVLRRTDARRAWHIVAGQLEPGESFPTAAARELREETGLDLPLTGVAAPQRYVIDDDYRPLYAPGVTEVVIQTFAVEAPPHWEPVLNDEHDTYRWCTVSEAMALLHWPEAKEALARLADDLGLT